MTRTLTALVEGIEKQDGREIVRSKLLPTAEKKLLGDAVKNIVIARCRGSFDTSNHTSQLRFFIPATLSSFAYIGGQIDGLLMQRFYCIFI